MISDVYRALWRHKMLIVAMTALLVGTTAVLTSRQTKLYTASSLVRVQQNINDGQEALGALITGERLARTYVPVAETKSVRDLAKAELRGRVPDDTFTVDAQQLSDLDLLNIAVTHRDPKVAAAVANAVPAALTSFNDRTDTFPDTITTVERASPPTTASSPNLKLRLVIALMLGLILGSGLALFREMLSDRIEGAEELERLTGHPVIATIPNLKLHRALTLVSDPHPQSTSRTSKPVPRQTAPRERAPMADRSSTLAPARFVDPNSASAEPFRTLRLALQLRAQSEDSATLLVTSAEPGVGKSTLAANYAGISARGGERVLLVDADLRNPAQHSIFGASRSPGLVEFAANSSPARRPRSDGLGTA